MLTWLIFVQAAAAGPSGMVSVTTTSSSTDSLMRCDRRAGEDRVRRVGDDAARALAPCSACGRLR